MALIESLSGIRGVYGKDLDDSVATRYGYAYAEFLRKRGKKIKVVIGRDTRESGEMLRSSIIDGLCCDIIDVGISPTPCISNAVREYKADGGVIITASHNEPEFNGFKFLERDGSLLGPEDVAGLIEKYHSLAGMDEEEFLTNLYSGSREVRNIAKMDSIDPYSKAIRKHIGRSRTKIVIDPNGGAGIRCIEILNSINARYINTQPGKFSRKVEPGKESLSYLQAEIKKHKAEFAVGFDCDADRIEILMKDGNLISGNQILALIVDGILSETKNPELCTVVANTATSYVVKELVEMHNARWKEVDVGEINIVKAMLDFNSPVGGEGSSGGVIIPPSRCRDGILALSYLLGMIEKKSKSLAEMVSALPEYYYIKEKVKLRKSFSIDKVKGYFLKNGYLLEEAGQEGSIKAVKGNSWLLLRQSRTESEILRIIADSKDSLEAKALIKLGKKLVSGI